MSEPLRIVVCWSVLSGYMAACWRELAARPGVELFVLAWRSSRRDNTAFSASLLDGVPYRLLDEAERQDVALIRREVLARRPQVVVVGGWSHPGYVRLAWEPELAGSRFLMSMDNQRRHDLRQKLARLKIGRFLDRMDAVLVPGQLAWEYARYLKVPVEKIHRGAAYGVDHARLAPLWDQRAVAAAGWPRSFLFIGQYVRRKGFDIALAAYRDYRARVKDPWPLRCCGMGPLEAMISDVPGVDNLGFVQPDRLAEVRVAAGVGLLPSTDDPWPLDIVEHSASGLPVLCSDACGSAIELVRPWYNGLIVATASATALADGMVRMHGLHDRLPEMGRRGVQMAEPYGASFWATRVLAAAEPGSGRS